MHLVQYFDDNKAAADAEWLLRSHGIPARSKPSSTGYKRGAAPRPSVSCFLGEQVEDAQKLLRDPNHVVTNPVDVDEFFKGLTEFEKSFDHSLLLENSLGWLFGTLLFCWGVWLLFSLLR